MKKSDCCVPRRSLRALLLMVIAVMLLSLAVFNVPRAYGAASEQIVIPETFSEAARETMQTETAEALQAMELSKSKDAKSMLPVIICVLVMAASLVGIICCLAALRKKGPKKKARPAPTMKPNLIMKTEWYGMNQKHPGEISVGQLHHIGARPYQEDSSGVANLNDGILAVVADGMGGLSGGDKVSQKIVYSMLEYSRTLKDDAFDGALRKMLDGVNTAVNQMLGPEGLQKSGSTLLAVLVRGGCFHWIAVGDSHIYLFHDGRLVQLNQEHNRGQELLRQAITEQLTFDEVRVDPKKSGLTSFIGMGKLRYVEKSLKSIPLEPGDRILLMTDGVFNALPDEEICTILHQTPDVAAAAKAMEQSVLSKRLVHQDNFTAIILGF